MSSAVRSMVWLLTALVAVAAVAIPMVVGLPPLQVAAVVYIGGFGAYLARGRNRRRRDIAMGLAAFVLAGLVTGVQTDPLLSLAWCGVMPVAYLLRGEREARRDPASADERWTGWRGRLVLLLITGAMVAGLVYIAVTVRSWRELFILGGPALSAQIAVIIGALVLLGRRLWLRWASRRWYATTLALVRPILAGVRRERAAPPEARETGASDDSLTKAVEHAEMALLLLESGPRLEAVGEVQRLAEVASVDGWDPSASLTREVRALVRAGRLGTRLRGRVDADIERPPSGS